jgi:hypothetical protein
MGRTGSTALDRVGPERVARHGCAQRVCQPVLLGGFADKCMRVPERVCDRSSRCESCPENSKAPPAFCREGPSYSALLLVLA